MSRFCFHLRKTSARQAAADRFSFRAAPTSLFQLMAIPKRGPDVILPVETRLYVKLMSPIYVETQPAGVAAVTPEPVAVPRQVSRAVAPANLDVLVSPVALYPDAILRD